MEAPIRTILSADGERFYVTLRGFRRDASAPDLLRLDFVRVKGFHSMLGRGLGLSIGNIEEGEA